MKAEELPFGTKVDLLERDGCECESTKVIDIEEDCLVLSFANKMTKGKYKIPLKSCFLRLTIQTKGNSLDKYKSEEYDNIK